MEGNARRQMLIDFTSKPPLPEMTIKSGHLTNYNRVYSSVYDADGEGAKLETYLAEYDRLNASHVVIKARDLESTFGSKISNEDVAEFCKQHGPRYIGMAGVDPHKGMSAVREFEYAVKELGLKGLNIQGFEHKLAINDKLLYPLYAKCIELGVPVNIHCGINFSQSSNMAYGRPMLLDEVLVHFPELRVCAGPPGWPWVHELLGVAWKHPNLWIGMVFIRPKLLGIQHSGYEPLLQYGRTILKHRIIFGSGFPMMSVESALNEIDELGIDQETKDRWLYANAHEYLFNEKT
ncbi:amidohydrolase family protein [Aliihoeflea sp. PC F10.4]